MKPVSILSILASTSAFEYTTDYGTFNMIFTVKLSDILFDIFIPWNEIVKINPPSLE